MSIYKSINKSDLKVTEKVTYYSQSLTSSDEGLFNCAYRTASTGTAFIGSGDVTHSLGNLYQSLFINFYVSASSYAESESVFNNPYHLIETTDNDKPIYTHKFHWAKMGRIYSIPQKYYGESIKPGTFSLTDSTSGYSLNLKDDGYGNIYASNTLVSQSGASSISSSENYIGNIFYRSGLVVLHETGSFSGSGAGGAYYVKDDSIGTDYKMNFSSTKTIFVSEYNVTINPHEFNMTNNLTAHEKISGSFTGYLSGSFYSHVSKSEGIVESKWSPYFNTIGFYDNDNMLVAVARYPQPIKVRDDIKLNCKIKLDF